MLFNETKWDQPVQSSQDKEKTIICRSYIQEGKNKRESIRRVISGQILRQYKFIRYTPIQTLTDRRKLSKTKSKTIDLEKQKRGFQPELHNQVLDFYRRDDVSIALPEKRDVQKIGKKKPRIQKRVLSDYLSNLYEKFVAENTNVKISFSTFARIRPTNFVLANFANRQSSLYVQHQNMALKLNTLKQLKRNIPNNPDVFLKTFSHEKILTLFNQVESIKSLFRSVVLLLLNRKMENRKSVKV